MGQRPRERNLNAGALPALGWEIHRAKDRFGLTETAPVLNCYEVRWESSCFHRYLAARGMEKLVVDSSSIEVNRRQRRVKTGLMDMEKLLRKPIQYRGNEMAESAPNGS